MGKRYVTRQRKGFRAERVEVVPTLGDGKLKGDPVVAKDVLDPRYVRGGCPDCLRHPGTDATGAICKCAQKRFLRANVTRVVVDEDGRAWWIEGTRRPLVIPGREVRVTVEGIPPHVLAGNNE